MRTVLLSVHILAVALWLGGSIMNGVINANVMKQDDLAASLGLARAEARLGMTFYMPMSILTLLTGIGLVIDGDFDWGAPWVSLGFLTVIAAAVLGPVKFQPLTDQMIAQYESGDAAAGRATGMQIAKWSSITTGLLLLSVIAMVWKP